LHNVWFAHGVNNSGTFPSHALSDYLSTLSLRLVEQFSRAASEACHGCGRDSSLLARHGLNSAILPDQVRNSAITGDVM